MAKLGEHWWTRHLDEVIDALVSRCARSEAEFWTKNFKEKRPEGGKVVLGIVDLEGEVGWGNCDGGGGEGGGVDEVAVGDVNEDVKVRKKSAPIRGMETSVTMTCQLKVLSLKESCRDLHP